LRIDLNNHTDAMKALKQRPIDKKAAVVLCWQNCWNLNVDERWNYLKCCEQ
jgi:hypothetical protein